MKRSLIPIVGILIALAVLLLLGKNLVGNVSVKETAVGKLESKAVRASFVATADLSQVATVISRGKEEAAWNNGAVGKTYPKIRELTFSGDEQHLLYFACTPIKQSLVIDDKEGPWTPLNYMMDATPSDQPYTYDGTHVEYQTLRGKQFAMMRDEKLGMATDIPFNRIFSGKAQRGAVLVSPDGKHTAYYVQRKSQSALVYDGKPGPWYDGMSLMHLTNGDNTALFSRDGAHYAYTALRGKSPVVVIDGIEKPRKPAGFESIYTSPNGHRIGYFAVDTKRKGNVLVLDGKTYGPYAGYYEEGPIFTADGTHFAMRVSMPKTDKWQVVVDGKPGKSFDQVSIPAYSADGKHLAYLGTRGKKTFLVLDGKERLTKGFGDELVVSDNGAHVAYKLQDPITKRMFLVKDD